MKHLVPLEFAVLALPALVGCAPAITSSQPEPRFAPEVERALEGILEKRMAEDGIPGAVVGVWVPGRGSWVRAAGKADLASGAAMRPEHRFRIASVTKTFTATVVLQLVDEGRLSLEDRLEPYVPGFPNGERITVRQLLGMTSGVYGFVEDKDFIAAYEGNPLIPFGPQSALEIARRHPPDFPPGEGFRYSDTNYFLLGLVVERITGRPVGEAIRNRVVQPLGLSSTSFPTTPDMPEPHAHGYATGPGGAGLRDVTRSNPDVAWTAGAMVSSLGDLKAWAEALATGRLLKPATQAERLRWTRVSPQPGSISYGLGVFEAAGFVGHNGSILGYSTWMVHLPEARATVVVLTNRAQTETETAGGIFFDVARLLFPERFPT